MRVKSEQTPLEKELTERMLDLMVRQKLITSAVFGNHEVMEMICRNQVYEIMGYPQYDLINTLQDALDEKVYEFCARLEPWEKDDEETKVINQAAIVAEFALVDSFAETMYVTVAELDYKKLKDYDLVTCVDRAYGYRIMLPEYEQTMGGYNAAMSCLTEQMISDLSEELGVC